MTTKDGVKGDTRRLRELTQQVGDKAAKLQGNSLTRWSTETHVRSKDDSVHVDLHDLDIALVDEVVHIVLGEAKELSTKRLRFLIGVNENSVDGQDLTSWLLEALEKHSATPAGRHWRVSHRTGRPYVDLRRQAPDTDSHDPPTFQTGQLRVDRGPGPAKAPRRSEPPPEDAPLALPGRDVMTEAGGVLLSLLIVIPLLIGFYGLIDAAIVTLGASQGMTVGLGLVCMLGISGFVVLWLVQRLIHPQRIHKCRNCGQTNRILPVIRSAKLSCGNCEAAIYGAWPIDDFTLVKCTSCKSPNRIEADKLVNGIPGCHHCKKPLATNARIRISG